jgi:hydrogenase expression/formation protein HypD
MKYVSEFRDPALAQSLATAIAREADPARSYAFMEFCGGHTHAIFRYGVQDLVPSNVRFAWAGVSGLRVADAASGRCARTGRAAWRDPGHLWRHDARAGKRAAIHADRAGRGADIRMVYSPLDALALARDNPGRQVVFMGIGFETTTPPPAWPS